MSFCVRYKVMPFSAAVENTQLLRREDCFVLRVVWNADHESLVSDVTWIRRFPLRALLEVR